MNDSAPTNRKENEICCSGQSPDHITFWKENEMFDTIVSAIDEGIIPPHPDVNLLDRLESDGDFTLQDYVYIGENIAVFGETLAKRARAELAMENPRRTWEAIVVHYI